MADFPKLFFFFSVFLFLFQDPNLGFTEETLLVEFIYYGHSVNRESDSSEGYAGSSTTFPYVSSVSEEIESSDQETQGTTINQSQNTIAVGDTSVFFSCWWCCCLFVFFRMSWQTKAP